MPPPEEEQQPPEEEQHQPSTTDLGDPTSPDANSRPKRRKKRVWFVRFAQQDLKGWSPIITGNAVVAFFFLSGCVLIGLGVAVLIASLGVKEVKATYTSVGPMAGLSRQQQQDLLWSNSGDGVPATVNLTIPEALTPPIYVYYELSDFYQNHKRYVRSRDNKQLAGKTPNPSSQCDPQRFVGDDASRGSINPCGLTAWSNFNDTFLLSTSSGAAISIDDSHIAWHYDQDTLYGHFQPVNYNNFTQFRGGNTTSTQFLDEDQHFIVWMRPAAHKTFRKLYGQINQPLAKGTTVQVNITNRYNTYSFGGLKAVVLSTSSWVGGHNNFLGIFYLIIGGASMLTAIAFLSAYHLGLAPRREFGDMNYLSWNRM
ncbi:hypothetical protein WJX72_009200 [[Myrmecia] bisecta]|uniref:ALA-interacting subunit n=1 Tax=[Myrmecia] bisecta TaxID=41462 RepID=A0AAW1P3M1_9CHLO